MTTDLRSAEKTISTDWTEVLDTSNNAYDTIGLQIQQDAPTNCCIQYYIGPNTPITDVDPAFNTVPTLHVIGQLNAATFDGFQIPVGHKIWAKASLDSPTVWINIWG